MEPSWDLVSTDVKKQAECNRNVKVDAENAGSDGSAEAYSSFEIGKALDESAARLNWRCANGDVKQVIEDISTNPQF